MYFDLEDQAENKYTKIDELIRFVKGGRILIAANSNSQLKTWHDLKTNHRGRKLEEYLANIHLHILRKVIGPPSSTADLEIQI